MEGRQAGGIEARFLPSLPLSSSSILPPPTLSRRDLITKVAELGSGVGV